MTFETFVNLMFILMAVQSAVSTLAILTAIEKKGKT